MWPALISGGLSLLSGLGAQQSAKKQAKTQAASDMLARMENERLMNEKNAANKSLGKQLLKYPEKTTEKVSETRTSERDSSETSTTASSIDNYSYVDVDAMMAAAEKAGFNPVTWLNAGGMQAYTQTGSRGLSQTQTDIHESMSETLTSKRETTRRGHNAAAAFALMSPEAALVTASQAVNIPSTMEVLGNAGTAAFNTYRQDAARQQSQDFQREMLGLQLNAIQRARAGGGTQSGTGTPYTSTSGSTTVSSRNGVPATGGGSTGFAGGGGNGVPLGGYPGDKVTVVNPYRFEGGTIDPTSPDAETQERRGGEIAGEMRGIWNSANEFIMNSPRTRGLSIPTIWQMGDAYVQQQQKTLLDAIRPFFGTGTDYVGSGSGSGAVRSMPEFSQPNRY